MEIKLDSRVSRRFSYIDRFENYLTLDTCRTDRGEGLIYKNQTLFSDFGLFLNMNGYHKLATRFAGTTTSVRPECFTVDYIESGINISVGLFDNALYFDCTSFTSEKATLAILTSNDLAKKIDKMQAIAASSKIEVSKPLTNELLQLTAAFGKNAVNARIIAFSEPCRIYISLEHSPAAAKKNSAKLLKEDDFSRHVQNVNDLLSRTKFSTGDSEYDSGLEWTKFSSLQFLNGKKNRALWAGLPWFRDYWGRDIFVSIPGTLLLSGDYNEAEAIFENFAKFQDTNPRSVTYGRIPNIYRGTEDVIYNTADATLWFTREVLETARFTGNRKFLEKMWPSVLLALECDRNLRTDSSGFLLHGDADTWMDARIFGEKSLCPRGNRANDIQALWWTALRCGAEIARILGKDEEKKTWENAALKIKNSFLGKFYDSDSENPRMADCLLRDETPDYRVRPNQLMLVTIPKVTGETFIPKEVEKQITRNAVKKLLFPYGICSLSQDDPFFHPYHNTSEMYHEDAAYHNGTIWTWNAGFTIIALCSSGFQNLAWIFAKNLSSMIVHHNVAGAMSANISAYPNEDGSLNFSGAYSSCRSAAEFSRAAWQGFLGMNVDFLEKDGPKIYFSPRIPDEWKEGTAEIPFGYKKPFCLRISWSKEGENSPAGQRQFTFELRGSVPKLEILVEFQEGRKSIYADESGLYSLEGTVVGSGNNELHFCQPDCLKNNWEKPECLRSKNFLAEICLRQEFNGSHPSSLTAIRS